MDDKLYDVVAVNIQTGSVRVVVERQAEHNAKTFARAVRLRSAIDEEFYSEVLHGTYHNGEEWAGQHRAV